MGVYTRMGYTLGWGLYIRLGVYTSMGYPLRWVYTRMGGIHQAEGYTLGWECIQETFPALEILRSNVKELV